MPLPHSLVRTTRVVDYNPLGNVEPLSVRSDWQSTEPPASTPYPAASVEIRPCALGAQPRLRGIRGTPNPAHRSPQEIGSRLRASTPNAVPTVDYSPVAQWAQPNLTRARSRDRGQRRADAWVRPYGEHGNGLYVGTVFTLRRWRPCAGRY